MKKLLLPVLLLCVFALSHAEERMSFGIKGGVSFTNLYTEDVSDNNILIGINAGIVAIFPITNFLAVQPEILFSGKGAELEYNNILVTGKAKFKLSYIELPVLLRINFTDAFSIHLGPYVSYLISAKIKNDTSEGIFDFEENINTENFEKFDYGLSAGIEFTLSPINIGARYNYGLANIGKERSILGVTYTLPDAKNSALNVYLALRF